MSPPKRALFSLNLDTEADHVHRRVTDFSKEGTDRVKILETKGPTHTHADLTYATKPFERLVDRTVNEVLDETGKKVHFAEGEITYSSNSAERQRDGTSKLNVVSKPKRRQIEAKYDTSEL